MFPEQCSNWEDSVVIESKNTKNIYLSIHYQTIFIQPKPKISIFYSLTPKWILFQCIFVLLSVTESHALNSLKNFVMSVIHNGNEDIEFLMFFKNTKFGYGSHIHNY